ncbi:unnamed protein product [Rhizoctonia solani]|nr:unnamed protein product [Rhizoctonia solani]
MVQSSFVNFAQLKKTLALFTSWLAKQGVLHVDLESTAKGAPIYTNYTSCTITSLMRKGWRIYLFKAGKQPALLLAWPDLYAMRWTTPLPSILRVLPLLGTNHPDISLPWVVKDGGLTSERYTIRTFSCMASVIKLTHGFLNQSDVNKPDAANAYRGSNYLRAKAKWGPENVLQVWHGVGSPSLGNGTQPVCA